jgi:hypothetical protein
VLGCLPMDWHVSIHSIVASVIVCRHVLLTSYTDEFADELLMMS